MGLGVRPVCQCAKFTLRLANLKFARLRASSSSIDIILNVLGVQCVCVWRITRSFAVCQLSAAQGSGRYMKRPNFGDSCLEEMCTMYKQHNFSIAYFSGLCSDLL